MNAHHLIAQLERTPPAVVALLRGLHPEEARFKPPSGAWSIVEIVNHLADEDRDDFRRRLRLTLEQPGAPWPTNDPEEWARVRKYQDQDLEKSLVRFESERAESLLWLRSLRSPDWKTAYQHPRVGPVTAGELMVSWPAHDALHVRQIAKRLYELAGREGAAEGFPTKYAGEWGA